MKEIKQVLVARGDLSKQINRGKEASQIAHASSLASFIAMTQDFATWEHWMHKCGMRKICVKAENEDELFALKAVADARGIPSALIVDEGRTYFKGVHTVTALAIGPAPEEDFVGLTDHLPLY